MLTEYKVKGVFARSCMDDDFIIISMGGNSICAGEKNLELCKRKSERKS